MFPTTWGTPRLSFTHISYTTKPLAFKTPHWLWHALPHPAPYKSKVQLTWDSPRFKFYQYGLSLFSTPLVVLLALLTALFRTFKLSTSCFVLTLSGITPLHPSLYSPTLTTLSFPNTINFLCLPHLPFVSTSYQQVPIPQHSPILHLSNLSSKDFC